MQGSDRQGFPIALLVERCGGDHIPQHQPGFLKRAREQAGATAMHPEHRQHPLLGWSIEILAWVGPIELRAFLLLQGTPFAQGAAQPRAEHRSDLTPKIGSQPWARIGVKRSAPQFGIFRRHRLPTLGGTRARSAMHLMKTGFAEQGDELHPRQGLGALIKVQIHQTSPRAGEAFLQSPQFIEHLATHHQCIAFR